jgi:hypothetical protein
MEAHLTPSYDRWRQRLAGEKVVTYTEPDAQDLGFYRLPIKERKKNAAGENNGQWKTIGFKPVALYIAGENLACQIGNLGIDDDQRNDAWTSFVRHPITEEVWRAVAERGEPWPDFAAPDAAAAKAIVEGRFTEMEPLGDSKSPAPPHLDIKARLVALKASVSAFAKIESDEQSSAARGLQAQFLELKGEAAGHYEQASRPLLEQQKKLREIWFPLRDEADEAKTALGTAMGLWEDEKRAAAKRASDEAAKRAIEHEAAKVAAEAANKPPPPPPEVERPNMPMPSSQIKAPGARAAKVKLQRIVTEIDVEKAFAQFKAAPEVREVLMALAQRAITAGLPVDGATIQERSKVS